MICSNGSRPAKPSPGDAYHEFRAGLLKHIGGKDPAACARSARDIRAILKLHNLLEEDPGGMYEQCEEAAGVEIDEVLRQLQDAPNVRVAPNVDGPNAFG
jgi:hypothetical protein